MWDLAGTMVSPKGLNFPRAARTAAINKEDAVRALA
jgi:hypothetical protein